jgi:phosphohistidine phosphatase
MGPSVIVEGLVKTLLIMRHAKSSWKNARLADHDRPLSRRGREDAPRMGRHLRTAELVPDLIISSSARRTVDTAEAIVAASGSECEVLVTRRLYLGGPEDYLDALSVLDDGADIVMAVGHNPGLEELLEYLVGVSEFLPTGAVAQVGLDIDAWGDVSSDAPAELLGVWLPKMLPRDS